MELRHLRYFVAVGEELNFTRAAVRLGINQPPLSLQIRQLENELGTQLLYRRTRGIELTDAGKLMLEEARIILRQVETAKIDAQRRARGETGHIIVGSASGIYFHPLVPKIIHEYRSNYPDTIFTPEATNTTLLVSRLRARKVDAAFIWRPLSHTDDLTIEPIVEEDGVIAIPAGHRLSNLAAVSLAALAKDRFIFLPRALHPNAYDLLVATCHHAGFTPAIAQEAPEMMSIIPLVAAGFGVAIVPRFLSGFLVEGVRYLSIEGDSPRMQISLACRRHERSRSVQNFLAVARRVAQSTLNRKGYEATV